MTNTDADTDIPMSGTISLATLHELFDYNYWARDRQLQTCAGLTEEQFLRPLGNSFPSVRDTLTHLLAVEWLWLERWRGKSPRTLLAPEEFPTLAALCERWQTVEREMREYVSALTVDLPIVAFDPTPALPSDVSSRPSDGALPTAWSASAQSRFSGRVRRWIPLLTLAAGSGPVVGRTCPAPTRSMGVRSAFAS